MMTQSLTVDSSFCSDSVSTIPLFLHCQPNEPEFAEEKPKNWYVKNSQGDNFYF